MSQIVGDLTFNSVGKSCGGPSSESVCHLATCCHSGSSHTISALKVARTPLHPPPRASLLLALPSLSLSSGLSGHCVPVTKICPCLLQTPQRLPSLPVRAFMTYPLVISLTSALDPRPEAGFLNLSSAGTGSTSRPQ